MALIAMDLGTCNTCTVLSLAEQNNNAIKIIILPAAGIGQEKGSIPTVLLYEQNIPILIGSIAENEFGETNNKNNYALRAIFKPDIAISEDAKKWMIDFLKILRQAIIKSPLISEEDINSILVGVPSQAEENYLNTLYECLETVGWKEIAFLPEPVGALMNYVVSQELPPARAINTTLIVDFGGGTCDLAVLNNLKTRANQGDMIYGGRIFDDLFYQILLEKNPKLENELKKTNNDYFVHWTVSRRVKEEFSEAIFKNQNNANDKVYDLVYTWSYFVRGKIFHKNESIKLSLADFQRKAGNYKASKDLLDLLAGHKKRAGLSAYSKDFLDGKIVDLFTWFGNIVDSIIDRNDDIQTVLLTGGSSSWYFIHQLIKKKLGNDINIILGPEPHSDVAKGIAKFNIFKQQYEKSQSHLKKGLKSLEKNLKDLIAEKINNGINELYDNNFAKFLQKVILIPALKNYGESGGSLNILKVDMENRIKEHNNDFKHLLANSFENLSFNIVSACRQTIKTWFETEQIPILPESVHETRLELEINKIFGDLNHELWNNFIAGKALLLEFTSVLISSCITVLATFLVDPTLGGVAIATIGLTTFASLYAISKLSGLSSHFKKLSSRVILPKIIRKKIFAEEKLDKMTNSMIAKTKKNFIKHIVNEMSNPVDYADELHKAIMQIVNDELNGLQIINNIQIIKPISI